MKHFEQKMEALASEHSLDFKRCTEYHFQLKGIFLLNIYPSKQSYYIQGSEKKIRFTDLDELVKVCLGTNNVTAQKKKTERKSLKSKKPLLWSKSKFCFFCGGEIISIKDATIEHKIPLSRGGSNRIDNLALSHDGCNQSRENDLRVAISVNEKKLIDKINSLQSIISLQEKMLENLRESNQLYRDRESWYPVPNFQGMEHCIDYKDVEDFKFSENESCELGGKLARLAHAKDLELQKEMEKLK